jgi:hypothetical protein
MLHLIKLHPYSQLLDSAENAQTRQLIGLERQ